MNIKLQNPSLPDLFPMPMGKIFLKISFMVAVFFQGIHLYFQKDNFSYHNDPDQMETKEMIDDGIKTAVEDKVLKRKGYNIHYYTCGDKSKDAIVFLHPAFADHRCFNKQLEYFSRDYHVITIDLLGHGQSKVEKAKDKIDASTDHLIEILEIEGHAKAHIAGVSMGSLIAQQFAFLHPEKVNSLTVLSGYNIHKDDKEIKKAQRKELGKWLFKALFSMDSFRRYVATVSVSDPVEQAHIYEMARSFTRKSFSVMSGLSNILKAREAPKRSYPLLLISGELDIDLSKKKMREWHEEEPESYFYNFMKAGHCVNMDDAQQFNELVMGFCKGEIMEAAESKRL